MDYKELAKKIEEAVGELHRATERQDAEIKKLGQPSAESKAQIEKIQADITSLMAHKAEVEKMQARIDDLEVKMQRGTVPKPGEGDKTEAQRAQKAAFYKFIRHGHGVLTSDEKKALVSDPTGRFLLEPELDAEIWRILPRITIIRGLATVRKIGTDSIRIKSIGGVSVGWGKLEVGAPLTESVLTPGAPITQFVEDLYGLAKIGEDLLMDSEVNLESILAEEFARALGEEEETRFILGGGHTVNQPEGITTNTTLVAAMRRTASMGAITVEDMMDLLYACPPQFRRNGSFIVNSATELALRRLRSHEGGVGTGQFLWQPSVQAGVPNTFLGRPIYTQDDIRTLADTAQVIAIFGDIKAGYRIIDRVGMTIQRLTELYSEAGLVGFKIHKRVTGGVINPSQRSIVLLGERVS